MTAARVVLQSTHELWKHAAILNVLSVQDIHFTLPNVDLLELCALVKY